MHTLVRLSKHFIILENTDFAFVELNKWIKFDLVLPEGHTLCEARTKTLSVLKVFNCTYLEVNSTTYDITLSNVVLGLHILVRWRLVLDALTREGFSIEEIKDPVILTFVLED